MNLSSATKLKVSRALTGRVPWNKGKQTGPRSAESVAKQSVSTKGKPKQSTEKMKGHSPWNKGRKVAELLSPESRAKISARHKGKSKSIEHNLKNSLAQKEYQRLKRVSTIL